MIRRRFIQSIAGFFGAACLGFDLVAPGVSHAEGDPLDVADLERWYRLPTGAGEMFERSSPENAEGGDFLIPKHISDAIWDQMGRDGGLAIACLPTPPMTSGVRAELRRD